MRWGGQGSGGGEGGRRSAVWKEIKKTTCLCYVFLYLLVAPNSYVASSLKLSVDILDLMKRFLAATAPLEPTETRKTNPLPFSSIPPCAPCAHTFLTLSHTDFRYNTAGPLPYFLSFFEKVIKKRTKKTKKRKKESL